MNRSSLYTVLNVDDIQATRHARTVALRQAGYRVIEAADQEEALCLAAQESPALFLPHAENEEHLQVLADNAPAFIWVNGPEGCQYVNRACLRFLGVGEGEVRGYAWTKFLHPEDREHYVEAYLEAVALRSVFEAKCRFLRHDGEYRWMKSVGVPWLGGQGEFLGYVGSSIDIHDVHLVAEQKTRESDMVLGLALDAAGMTAWHLNLITGAVREAGEVWKLFNRPAGFLHKSVDSWQESIHPEDRERVHAAFQRSIREGSPFNAEYRTCPDAEGLVRWVHSVGSVGRSADGRPISAYGIARDITERKQTEEALRCSRQRTHQQHVELELIYRNVPVGLCVVDREFRYLRINERLAGLNGVPVSEHLGRTVREVLPDLAGQLEPIWRRVLETGESILNVELRGMAPKHPGIERDWLASYVPVRDSDGEIYGIGCVVEEITDRKQAERALLESERHFRSMFDLAATGKTLLDARSGRFVQVNDRFCEITGYSRDELMQMSPADLTHPDDRQRDLEGFGKLLRGEIDEYHVEKRYLRRDGATRWVAVAVSLLRDADGHPLRTTAVIQDVTDRKEAEQALQESEQRLRLFIENAPAAIAMLDRDMRYLAVSRRWLEDYDLSERAIIGRSHYDTFPDIPDRWKELHRRALAGATLSNNADRFDRADGSVRWLKWQIHPWWSGAGEVRGIILFTEDITARMLAEEALRESEERLRFIAERAGAGYWHWDLIRDRTEWSSTCKRLFGIPEQEPMSKARFLSAVHPDDRIRVEGAVRDCLQGSMDYDVEYRTQWPDGTVRWIHTKGNATLEAGRPVRMAGIALDITGRKQTEAALRASEELLRTATDNARVGLVVLDADRRYTFVNPAYRELMGLGGVDMIGRRMDEMLGLLYEQICHCLERVYAGERVSHELSVPGAEGEHIKAYAVICEPRWETDRRRVAGMVAVVTDITERKQGEAELKAIAWLLREHATQLSAPEPQPYGDLTELNRTRTILRTVGKDLLANMAGDALNLLGSSGAICERNGDYAAGLFTSHWCRFLDQTSRMRCGTADNRAALANGDWHCHESCREVASRSMDEGEPVDMPCKGGIRLYAVPIRVDGETVGSINVGYGDPPKDQQRLSEVAERYAVPLNRLRELSDSMPSRPQFIVEVAKARVRSSAVLLGEIIKRKRAEEALRDLTEHLEHRIAERTEEVVHSQEQLRMLATELNLAEQRERKRLATELHDHLQQILVLGKLQIGQGKGQAQSIPACAEVLKQLDEVLSEALAYTRTLVVELSPPVLREHGLMAGLKWLGDYMRKHRMTVTVTVREQREPALPEDQAVLLFQSVRELLINSSKHGGTGEATVTVEQREGQLRIEVRDEGEGFDLAAAAAVGGSTGGLSSKFGLLSIRERMKALGGEFDMQSAPGKGVRATLLLPLRAARDSGLSGEAAPAAVSRQAGQAGKPDGSILDLQSSMLQEQAPVRVLLVDDHVMVRQGLRSLLDGYPDVDVIGEAWDGEEAVAAVEQLRPRVVVMDINMPKKNGIDATVEIKARHPDIEVIGLSVNAGGDNQTAMLKAGASRVLTKEAAVEYLYGAIQQAVKSA